MISWISKQQGLVWNTVSCITASDLRNSGASGTGSLIRSQWSFLAAGSFPGSIPGLGIPEWRVPARKPCSQRVLRYLMLEGNYLLTTGWCTPVIGWFINPVIAISTINHRFQPLISNLAILGAPSYSKHISKTVIQLHSSDYTEKWLNNEGFWPRCEFHNPL